MVIVRANTPVPVWRPPIFGTDFVATRLPKLIKLVQSAAKKQGLPLTMKAPLREEKKTITPIGEPVQNRNQFPAFLRAKPPVIWAG